MKKLYQNYVNLLIDKYHNKHLIIYYIMKGYYCRHCYTNTKDERVKMCEYCEYEVCHDCPYNNLHKCNNKKNLIISTKNFIAQ